MFRKKRPDHTAPLISNETPAERGARLARYCAGSAMKDGTHRWAQPLGKQIALDICEDCGTLRIARGRGGLDFPRTHWLYFRPDFKDYGH